MYLISIAPEHASRNDSVTTPAGGRVLRNRPRDVLIDNTKGDRFQALNTASRQGTLIATNLAFDITTGGSLRPIPSTLGQISGSGSIGFGKGRFTLAVTSSAGPQGPNFTGRLQFVDLSHAVRLQSQKLSLVRIESDGSRAVLQGTATLGGRPGYQFMAWLKNGATFQGRRGQFRIVIEGPDGFRYDSHALCGSALGGSTGYIRVQSHR